MSRLAPATWLQLADAHDLSIIVHDRLGQITAEVPSPSQQRPRLVHFIGRREKHTALQNVFPQNQFGRWNNRCFASLRIDTISRTTASPLLISESDLNGCFEKISRELRENSFLQHLVRWYHKDLADLDVNDTLQARIIFTFTDVVCIFIDDFASLECLVQRLLRWALLATVAPGARVFSPRLLLVASKPKSFQEFQKILSKEGHSSLTHSFASIEIFHLGSEALSPMARHRRLREAISTQTLAQLENRKNRQLDLSMCHFSALLTKNIDHVSFSIIQPFEIARVARSLGQANMDMTPHITTFIRGATELHFPRSVIIDYVASAILMDAYPVGMHVFESHLMYSFYEPQILDEVGFDLKPAIEKRLSDLVSEINKRRSTSLSLRKQCLALHVREISQLSTNATCLFCLSRAPEHVLECKHTIYDVCVQRFGVALPGMECKFIVRDCALCASAIGNEFLLKPPTAGVRIMSIDGGGTRGAIPLESLRIVQDLLGPLPLQACFDLAVGTSSGGLIVLALFTLNWSPGQASQAFDILSRRIFAHKQQGGSYYAAMRKYLRCWIKDGVYDHTSLEEQLKSVFGEKSRLFGAPQRLLSQTKCAVTTCSIFDGAPYLLSNYNGDGTREKPQGYEVLRPENAQQEPLIWEAARATSAAPVLFRSYNMADIGAFQDGGLKHNNPSRIAYWESRRVWPEIKTPDIFLSLGTGAPERAALRQRVPTFRNFLIDGFIPRLFRSCMSKADGEIMWKEFLNSLDERVKPSYFRLNIPLEGAAMIDDIDTMDSLRQSVRLQPDSTRIEVVRGLLSACFYFQLHRKLVKEVSSYRVEGSIRCRVDSTLVSEALQSAGLTNVEFTTELNTCNNYKPLQEFICQNCSLFRKDISFYIRSPQDLACIYMSSPTTPKYKISGFPQSLEWFELQQGLDKTFGSAADNISEPFSCQACSLGRRLVNKRDISQLEANTSRKRQCLSQPTSRVINERKAGRKAR